MISPVESGARVIAGYGAVVVTQILVAPIFGPHRTPAQIQKMGAVFTAVSVARSIDM